MDGLFDLWFRRWTKTMGRTNPDTSVMMLSTQNRLLNSTPSESIIPATNAWIRDIEFPKNHNVWFWLLLLGNSNDVFCCSSIIMMPVAGVAITAGAWSCLVCSIVLFCDTWPLWEASSSDILLLFLVSTSASFQAVVNGFTTSSISPSSPSFWNWIFQYLELNSP